jgi:hypothetical protein
MAVLPPRTEPQDGDRGLLAHPYRFTYRGAPQELAFPPLCANCGEASAGTIRCAKVFRRTHDEASNEYLVSAVDVPFCAACRARHHGGTPEPTRLSMLLSSFSTAEMFGAVFPGLTALFFLWLALKDVAAGRFLRGLTMLPFAAVFALIAEYMRRHVWAKTAHLRVPPPSDVSTAFDFSDDVAAAFEPPRFVCTLRNARFAQAFELLNHAHEWVAHSPQARVERRRANRKMWIGLAIVAALFLIGLIVDGWK